MQTFLTPHQLKAMHLTDPDLFDDALEFLRSHGACRNADQLRRALAKAHRFTPDEDDGAPANTAYALELWLGEITVHLFIRPHRLENRVTGWQV